MNFLSYTCGIILLFSMATCNESSSGEVSTITGTIEESGITSYQYGTHVLSTEETFYAIKSDAVNLNDYLNREVTVEYEKIAGYPVDGGPEYLEIIKVK